MERAGSENVNAYLGEEPIGRLLMKFAIPSVLAMLVGALYNIVDQVFIGQGVGYLGNAATNVVFPFTVLGLAVALMIGNGSATLLSLSLGKGDLDRASRSVGNGISLAVVAALSLTAFGFFFEEDILVFFGATDACLEYSREYMTTILIGMPFYILTFSMNSIIRADGSPLYSMTSTVVGAVINFVLDPVAIFVLNMGVGGAAAATVIGQVITCIMSLVYFRKTKSVTLSRESFRPDGHMFLNICRVGISTFVIQIAIVIVIGVANNLIVEYGPLSIYGADIPLSATGIVMKLFGIVMAFSVGITIGGQPIAGYNYGAGNYSRVLQTYRYIVSANLAVGVSATLLFEGCPKAVIGLFGSGSDLYNQYAYDCLRIYLMGITLCCVQKAGSIFMQSIGKTLKANILSLSRDLLFFVPALLVITPRFGVVGMLWAAPAADVLSFLTTVAILYFELRHMSRMDALATDSTGRC